VDVDRAAVNSGISYVGNVGSKGLVDFTALGDTVNTASRWASFLALLGCIPMGLETTLIDRD
jgi:hypothetical protein